MALRLYRRHRNECEAGFAKDFKSGEFEESRRGWKHPLASSLRPAR